jgi:hypothetical protein
MKYPTMNITAEYILIPCPTVQNVVVLTRIARVGWPIHEQYIYNQAIDKAVLFISLQSFISIALQEQKY